MWKASNIEAGTASEIAHVAECCTGRPTTILDRTGFGLDRTGFGLDRTGFGLDRTGSGGIEKP
jgi:hypothetical protein